MLHYQILNFEMMYNRIFNGKKINVLHRCKLCKVYVEISDDFHKCLISADILNVNF